MIDELNAHFVLKLDTSCFDEFDRAIERMVQNAMSAFALAYGSKPVDAIAHRMERD